MTPLFQWIVEFYAGHRIWRRSEYSMIYSKWSAGQGNMAATSQLDGFSAHLHWVMQCGNNNAYNTIMKTLLQLAKMVIKHS